MRNVDRNDPCPCGSGQKYKKCCAPALAGAVWPETPAALMRSRYTAYVVGHAAHLYRTTHPENAAVRGIDYERFVARTVAYCRQVAFTGLTVHAAWPADEHGVARVQFTAQYVVGGTPDSFAELSDFVQVAGRWVYLRGQTPLLPASDELVPGDADGG